MNTVCDEKLNRAVKACLDRCYGSRDMVSEIAAFCAELGRTAQWTKREIHAVEMAVLEVLHVMVE